MRAGTVHEARASRVERWGEKIGRPNEKGGQGSEVWTKTGAVMSGDSIAANHVEHGIATFPDHPLGSIFCSGRSRCVLSNRGPSPHAHRAGPGRVVSCRPQFITTMPQPRRPRHGPKPDRRRALELLAASPD